MVTLPQWLKPNILVVYRPTGVMFHAVHCEQDPEHDLIFLRDGPNGSEYPLLECEQATMQHFRKARSYVFEGKRLTISPHELGCVVTNGRRKLLVQLREFDPIQEACESLAKAFNGTIVSEEIKIHRQYADEPEYVEEVPNDW